MVHNTHMCWVGPDVDVRQVDALVGSRDAESEAEASRRFKSELLQQASALHAKGAFRETAPHLRLHDLLQRC